MLGGVLEDVSIGPVCKVRGEVESSVFVGFANKAHDGFLGHTVVGCWVNLGAMTANSDLKNTYGPVRARVGGRTTDTGLTKAGSLLGDHVRTGIGTLLIRALWSGRDRASSVEGWHPLTCLPFPGVAPGGWPSTTSTDSSTRRAG